MSEKNIIAVVGATGAQGGGLVRAIVGDPGSGFAARALTRDVSSEKARALAKLGVEVLAADLDDVASLKRAFTGAYGVFCLTNFWEHFSPKKNMRRPEPSRSGEGHGSAACHLVYAGRYDKMGAVVR